MRFALTDEQSDLRASVRGALEREAGFDVVRRWIEARDATAANQFCVRQGLIGIGVTPERGGQGGGMVELALTIEELARAAMPGTLHCHTGLALPLVTAAASADPLAAQLIAGERLATVLIDAAVPPAFPSIQIRSDDQQQWFLTGTVEHVLGAPEVDVALVVGTTADSGPSLFAVSIDDPGVTVEQFPAADLTRRFATVTLDGVAAVWLGDLSAAGLATLADRAAVLVAADSLGAAARMLEMTVEYVRDREQFGVVVGSFQAVKHEAAEMLVDVESSRSLAYFAAWSLDAGQPDAAQHAAAAKFVCCEAAARAADHALTLHGAVGFTWEHDLHFLYKRAKSNLALYGSSAQYREQVAAALLD